MTILGSANPNDRDQIDIYILEIETDHRIAKDGNMVAYDKIVFGKKGSGNYQWIIPVRQLEREFPDLWRAFRPAYDQWKQDNTIPVEGTALEDWAGLTKAQIKQCRAIGLRSVEDIATASSSIRERIGMGGNELVDRARKFLENKDRAADANRMVAMEQEMAAMKKLIEGYQAEALAKVEPSRRNAAPSRQ